MAAREGGLPRDQAPGRVLHGLRPPDLPRGHQEQADHEQGVEQERDDDSADPTSEEVHAL